MAGLLVSDGCSQMLKLYMIWLGLHKAVEGVTFRPVNGQPNKAQGRGAISPHKGKLIYWMEIQEIGFDKSTGYPFCRANVNIIDIDFEKGQSFDHPNEADLMATLKEYCLGNQARRVVVDFQGVALQLEGTPRAGSVAKPPAAAARSRWSRATTSAASTSAASASAAAPPKEYMCWGKPVMPSIENGLTWHPLAGKDGNSDAGHADVVPAASDRLRPLPGQPERPTTRRVSCRSRGSTCASLCATSSRAASAPSTERFDVSTSSRSPAFDLGFTTRVLTVTGMEEEPGNNKWYNVDCNPGTGTMTAEFDARPTRGSSRARRTTASCRTRS